ncbi:MAG: molybdopterin dinucleotide binding domain-containing protein, partial [Dehalococcoidia bacterium]|nr:molybdopterin dinucleotide binding domain-containing protein [Dehalococcoidia bacterium]
RAILEERPYPIKALVVNYNNIMGANANASLVYQALKSPKLELVTVMEQFMTPTAELADYVLPAAHWLEKPSLNTFLGWADWAIGGDAAVPLRPGLKSDYDFFRELGLRLGQAAYWPPGLENLWDECLKPGGLTFRELMDRKEFWIAPAPRYRRHEEVDPTTGQTRGFGTPTGKVELSSTILERLGYNPMPEYSEPAETPYSRPDLARDYPLVLTTGGTNLFHTHQDHRQIASLRRMVPDPLVEVHPETGSALDIAEGDWVCIETVRGKVRQRAKLTRGIDPRVVNADRWWYPEEPGPEPSLHGFWIANINICTDDDPDHCDPMYGSWPVRGLLCRLSKAPAPELGQGSIP